MDFEFTRPSPKHVLAPIDAISELLFGLIMVLSFTGTYSIATLGKAELHQLLVGTLGCNLAWGIIDGVFYLIDRLSDKGSGQVAVRLVRSATSTEAGRQVITDALPDEIVGILQPAELEHIRERIARLPEPVGHPRLEKDDWLGAVSICLLMVVAALPVVIPFLFMHDAAKALRVSNLIAMLLLFFTGFAHGRALGHRPWVMGLAMVLLGSVLVGITIALGG
jgi:hypothetical protein